MAAAASPSPALHAASSAGVRPAQPSRRLEFKATFRGSRLNTKVWDTCYPWVRSTGCTNFGNREYEWYQPGQDRVSGGALRLVAQRKRTVGLDKNGKRKVYGCRSGMVTTYPGFRFEYGRVQVVARLPYITGMWPALWLAAANLRWPPEMDLVEHWGSGPHTEVVFHAANRKEVARRVNVGNLSVGWHTFTLIWSRSKIVWKIDGASLLTVRHRVPHQEMYLIADLADYKAPTSGARCRGAMLIRSVRVWNH